MASQSEDFHRWLGIQGEEFQHKLDLVVEGHQMVSEKLDWVESSLAGKIDAVAADLTAHRADTDAHHIIYRVKEDDTEYKG
ncbi:hypothetical protein JFN91_18420 [Geomonas sp. Red421]|uniref:Uncharacterized protein n=1 Tax=Geomonas anaerohicana TaxID=2798583 RepID=A0ABS0YIW6_9BACT|nr:hypothetical protein [Geomonas anaerohicana]